MTTQHLTRRAVLLLALACGVAVGTVYFPQAISPLVASGLHVPPDSAALVVTATQLGYAAGIFLLVPLGDRFPHRPLIVTLLGLTGLGLLAAGAASGLTPLLGASILVGTTVVVAPIIAPMAAGLVADDRRGAVTGTLLAGSIGGMLGPRVRRHPGRMTRLASALPGRCGAGADIAVVLAATLPKTTPPSRQRYPALLAESLKLLRTEPELRRSGFYQAMVFAGFSAVWTGVALLLTGPTYHLGAPAVGALALIGAATMFCTPIAGRQADRHGPDPVDLVTMIAALASAAILLIATTGGAMGIAALIVGALVLDVAMQSGMVANQVRFFAVRPEVRSRLNTAYMRARTWAAASARGWR